LHHPHALIDHAGDGVVHFVVQDIGDPANAAAAVARRKDLNGRVVMWCRSEPFLYHSLYPRKLLT
jgi:hypothetical protein